MKEEWRSIKGYEGLYEVSNLGRVKSLEKEWVAGNRGSKRRHGDMIMIPKMNKIGYPQIGLSKNGKTKTYKIHRLVLGEFVGYSSFQVNHIDGIKSNSYLNNLEYCSCSENIKHAFKIGLMSNIGEKNPRAKLNREVIKNIRENKYVLNRFEFAACYEVSISTIEKIINKKLWAHVQ